ncbi:MAG TPA: hypothetical protein VJB35_01310 [Candidatus Nanoarchaeia archaeon]|nr:hypothetical protein [Candidatus Nanoarchaeia archaeon]
MQEIIRLLIGIFVLILGFPIGIYLSKITSEELKSGQKWFKIIILISLVSSIISLILRNDLFLFSFLFIAIVTSMSLNKK